MIDPTSSETYMSWAVNMRKAFGDQYLVDLGKQELTIAKGGLDAAQAVASGAADVSFSAMANQAEGLLAQGAPIGVVEVTNPALGNEHSIGIAAKAPRSEEHTSEPQSLMRNSYAVFCLKKKKTNKTQ